jgi:polysaccharide pyruvyl transferase WcaK-like protein
MWGIQIPKKIYNRLLFKKILKTTKRIFARDLETVNEIKSYGYDNVEFFMDTSFFAYPRKKIQNSNLPAGRQGFKIQNWKKYIVVNLNKNAEKFLKELIEDVKHRYKKGYEILYVPIAKGNKYHYQDQKYANKIQQWAEIKDQRFTILDREENIDEFIKILAWASIVISSRLHLFLIASFLWLETKVYPYQKKIIKMQETIRLLDT